MFAPLFALIIQCFDVLTYDYMDLEKNVFIKSMIYVVFVLKFIQNVGSHIFLYTRKVTNPKNMLEESIRRFSPNITKWIFISFAFIVPSMTILCLIVTLATAHASQSPNSLKALVLYVLVIDIIGMIWTAWLIRPKF